MVAKGKLCILSAQHYNTVPLTAMTQLKDASHVRKRKLGEISADQQVSVADFPMQGQK